MATNTNLGSPVSVIMNKVAEATNTDPNRNINYVFPCYDLSPQLPWTINTSPQSISTPSLK